MWDKNEGNKNTVFLRCLKFPGEASICLPPPREAVCEVVVPQVEVGPLVEPVEVDGWAAPVWAPLWAPLWARVWAPVWAPVFAHRSVPAATAPEKKTIIEASDF